MSTASRTCWFSCVAFTVMLSSLVANAGQNVVVVLDDSSSMNNRMRRGGMIRMKAAKEALITVLKELPDDSYVGVVALNSRRDGDPWIIPPGPIDHGSMEKSIRSIRPSRGTPLGEFMKLGSDGLLQLRQQRRYGTYRLLIVTDGEASDSHLVDAYLPDILSRGFAVDVIGVDMANDHSLATEVGTYRRADDPESLTQALSEVFAEIPPATDETSGDDFDLLAGLPSDVALETLTNLSETDNDPIDVKVFDEISPEFSVDHTHVTIDDIGDSDSGGPSLLVFGVMCVGMMMGLFVLVIWKVLKH